LKLSIKNRNKYINLAKTKEFDLVVIGGGITGAGILLDAVSRGLKVLLIEKEDFAFGTSSRSTKLIHGGLRYLKNLEFGIVRETGLERSVIQNNAAHLVRSENMLLPIFKDGALGKWTTSFGLMIYDNLAGVEKSEKRQMYSSEKVLELEPLLKSENLVSGGLYKEYRTDDARLVIELIKKAVGYGATALSYVSCQNFNYNGDQSVEGISAYDIIAEEKFNIKAKTVINACGPWVDELRKKDNSINEKHLLLTKGIHLVFDYDALPLKQSIYFDTPDGRMIFAIPKNDITYVGTTDTFFDKDKNQPEVKEEDILYLLAAIGFMFPSVKLTTKDVISSWVGLRPLIAEEGKDPSEISRKDEIFISKSNLISIAGGKLTGYRQMAKRATNEAVKLLNERNPNFNTEKCITRQIKLSGGDFGNPKDVELYIQELQDEYAKFVDIKLIEELFYRYGTNTIKILKSISTKIDEKELLIKELNYCIEEEGVCNISDFLIRRTSLIYFNPKKAEENLIFLQGYFTENFKDMLPFLTTYFQKYKEECASLTSF